MKKLLYRDILGTNPRKHEVSIEETFDRETARVTRKKICKYFIRQAYSSENTEDLKMWIRSKQSNENNKNCHILKQRDTDTGESTIVCKVRGDFYVVHRKTAYEITYLNEIRVQIDDME